MLSHAVRIPERMIPPRRADQMLREATVEPRL